MNSDLVSYPIAAMASTPPARSKQVHIAKFVTSIFFAVVAWVPSLAVGQLADSPWPDYGGGLRNTHQVDVVGPAHPSIAWTYQVAQTRPSFVSYAFRQPVLGSDGTIYFLTYPGGTAENIVALNPDGSLRWSFSSPFQSTVPGNWGAVDESGQFLYMNGASGSSSARLLSRDAATGDVLWVGPTMRSTYQTGPTVADDGTIYATDDDRNLQAITPSGQAIWNVSAGGFYVNPAIDPQGVIYTGGNALTALNSAGTVLWSIPAQNDLSRIRLFTSPAIDAQNRIFVGTLSSESDPGYLLAADAAGQQLWTRTGLGGAPSIGPDGTIYAGYRGVLHAMSPLNGQDLWTYDTGYLYEFGTEGVTIDKLGNLYFGTTRGHLLSLTPTGQLRWDLDLATNFPDDVFLSAPVLGADGTLYVGGGLTRQIFAIANVPEPETLTLGATLVPVVLLLMHRVRRSTSAKRWG